MPSTVFAGRHAAASERLQRVQASSLPASTQELAGSEKAGHDAARRARLLRSDKARELEWTAPLAVGKRLNPVMQLFDLLAPDRSPKAALLHCVQAEHTIGPLSRRFGEQARHCRGRLMSRRKRELLAEESCCAGSWTQREVNGLRTGAHVYRLAR